ncbi:LIM domain-binding protein 3 [Taenia solium]|eukprot:TsM_000360700 transcript=TsM_000360700 gene=TsM_000360700
MCQRAGVILPTNKCHTGVKWRQCKCSEPIDSDQKYAVIGGKPHHATCFICEVCQKSLYGGKYASKNGRITCLAHR